MRDRRGVEFAHSAGEFLLGYKYLLSMIIWNPWLRLRFLADYVGVGQGIRADRPVVAVASQIWERRKLNVVMPWTPWVRDA